MATLSTYEVSHAETPLCARRGPARRVHIILRAERPRGPGQAGHAGTPQGRRHHGDGFIDRKEAEAGLPRIAKNFDKIDTNQDGKLSTDELKQAAAARQRFGR
ncbi:MAG: hypothetical protein ACTHOL_14965 [Luteibacter jiangsuensis]